MGSKGSQTTTTQTGPPGYVGRAYQNLVGQAANVTQTPYTPYGGELAPLTTPEQQAGVGSINQYAFQAQPMIGQAAQYFQNSAQPLTPDQIQQYYSPYTQDVINATMANFQEGNAQQNQQVKGNAIAQGALGGDREAVAEAELARQQNLSQAPVIAGLENTGYGQAVNLAMNQFQQNPQAAGYGLGNVAVAGQSAGLQGAGAQFGAGTTELTQQAQLDALQQQAYWQQFYYPEQQLQFQAAIDTGVGSNAGGTSTTTGPPPSLFGQIAGLGIAGAGAYGAYQAGNKPAAHGGRIRGFALGGSPTSPTGDTYNISMPNDPYTLSAMLSGGPQLAHGSGPPKPPGVPKQQEQSPTDLAKMGQNIGGMFKGTGAGAGAGVGSSGPLDILGGGAAAGTGIGGLGSAAGDVVPVGEGLSTLGGAAGLGAGTDLAAGVGADLGIGAAADAGAAGAADLLPLLLLAKRGGRIYRNGGAARPIRSGLGMASFVPRRGYQEGGSPTFGERFAPFAGADNEPVYSVENTAPTRAGGLGALSTLMPQGEPESQAAFGYGAAGLGPAAAYGLTNPYTPVSQSASADELPPVMRGAPQGGAGLAYDEEPATGGLRAPPAPPPSSAPERPTQKTGPLGLSQDFYTSLMTAGLGMAAAAGRPGATPLGALGQGGLEGVGEYGALQKQHLSEQEVALKAKQLDQEAKFHQDQLAAQARPYSEMTAAQKAANIETEKQRNFPRIVQSWKDQYGVEHHVYGIPGPNGTWVDPITRKPLEMPAEATPNQPTAAPAPPPTAPAAPAVPGSPTSGGPTPQNPTAQLQQPVKVASLGAIPIPQGMTLNGQQVTPQALASAPETPKQYNDQALQGLTPEDQTHVKALINYDELPGQLAARSPSHRDLILARAKQYDPTYQPAQATNINRAKYDWDNGKHGDLVRNFSTAIAHVELLKGLISNLDNQGSNTWNRFANAFKSEFGFDAPTNYDAASRLVGNEIVKATVGGQNALGDRNEIDANFNRNRAPGQQLGVIGVYEGLMAGQLHSLERQYRNATRSDDFKTKYLSPEAQNVFYGQGLGAGAQTRPLKAGEKLYQGKIYTRGPNGEAVEVPQ